MVILYIKKYDFSQKKKGKKNMANSGLGGGKISHPTVFYAQKRNEYGNLTT
jgi:hypothetical protein